MKQLILAGALAVAACGGEKAAPPAESPPPATPMPQEAMMPDSMKSRMADSASKASGATKTEGPLRDSAYGPSFKIDSAGKVTPIKRP
jgi:hypothetical protein